MLSLSKRSQLAFLAMHHAQSAWRQNARRGADYLALAVAVALPWSTSATGILIALWALAFVPTIEKVDLYRELTKPAGALPFVLFGLGIVGLAWADVTLAERLRALAVFSKLLVIPGLMAQLQYSKFGPRILIAFLVACVALLIASFAVTIWPDLPRSSQLEGVPVKNYIVQSIEFTICAAVLLHLAIERAQARSWAASAGMFVLACTFLANVFFIASSRTTMVIIPALVLVYFGRRFGWRGIFGAAVASVALGAILWVTSPYLRERVSGLLTETEKYEADGSVTSTGERIVYWRKSVGFIAEAPLFGHGTGSIAELFRRAAAGQSGVRAEVTSNPHNQTLAVAIQLGLVGVAALWAMWISHLLLFRGLSLAAWIGLVVVIQNIVGSLFNSFLFDFTEGWLYAFGVGVAAAIARQRRI